MTFRMVVAAFVATLTFTQTNAAMANNCLEADHVLEAKTADVEAYCLTIEDLRELGSTEFETSTIWTDGVHRYTGVSLADLLAHLGAEGREIRATAINDYAITIPVSDAVEGGPIVAYEMDGAPMSRRTKGPLWIIYPYDSSAKYRTETIYSRSIWQLNRISITQ